VGSEENGNKPCASVHSSVLVVLASAQSRRRKSGRAQRAAGPALALALLFSGCTRFENVMASVPVFSFLRNAPSFDPYEAPRPAPFGSVPFLSPAGDVPVGLQPTEQALTAMGATLPNPLNAADTVVQRRGREMFDRHCMVCHGPEGKGDGPVVNKPGTTGKFPYAPNLTLPVTVGRTDGYLYGIIAVGRGLMPPYGPRMNHLERWATVAYLRQLQRSAGAAPAAAPAPAQGRQ
jgi:mono/diheme cytochrome c family protein